MNRPRAADDFATVERQDWITSRGGMIWSIAGVRAIELKARDERVHAFLDRPLASEWPYLLLDATYLKQREGGRIVSVAAIIAVA